LDLGCAFFGLEVVDIKEGMEDFVLFGDGLEGLVGEDFFEFTTEGFFPLAVGAAGRGEDEAALLEVFAEVIDFVLVEGEIAFAGEDCEGVVEEVFGGGVYGVGFAIDFDSGFTGGEIEESGGEADCGLGGRAIGEDCYFDFDFDWGGGVLVVGGVI